MNNKNSKRLTRLSLLLSFFLIIGCTPGTKAPTTPQLKVSENKRFLTDENGDPFFWLGDTGWLLFKKLNREEAEKYLEDRKQKGFNVIQVMVIHNILNTANFYGDSALIGKNVAWPKTTEGSSFDDPEQYDFWDHVDFIIEKAAEKGIYMALVPIWGSNVKGGNVSREEGKIFSAWLAERYRNQWNIIWLTGGDVRGSIHPEIWIDMGETFDSITPDHLVTFHPFGRTQSSKWFHNEEWLDFNMFQSGHRRYDQDDTELGYGPDNWRYVETDYNLTPTKPTIDGEPSYEGIPEGLHDTTQPYWDDADLRRYAYWSVFAGGFGFTYGNNAVMQFHKPGDEVAAYGAKNYWSEALDDPGAGQMVHLKNLILSKPFFERIPDESLIAGDQEKEYSYLLATRGTDYAFVYTYTGKNMEVAMGKIEGESVKASWFNPRDGSYTEIDTYENKGVVEFDPPGEVEEGNDWVLQLESIN